MYFQDPDEGVFVDLDARILTVPIEFSFESTLDRFEQMEGLSGIHAHTLRTRTHNRTHEYIPDLKNKIRFQVQ